MSTLTSAQNKRPMESLTIDEWVKQLGAIPEKEFTIPRVLEFTEQKAIQPETLAPYIFYANSHYTRNLIYKCKLFEILAICWNVGQVSRIHNHRGQNCWMVTPIGRLRVQNFRVENRDAAHGSCKLIPSDSYIMDPTHPAVVRPEEPVHQVQNLQEFNQPCHQRAHLFLSVSIPAKCIPSIKARTPTSRCTIPANTASCHQTKN